MAEKKTDTENKTAETEKGFGTGLRAQLARRRDGGPLEPPAASPRRAASENEEKVELVEPSVAPEAAKRADTPLLDAAAGELDALRAQAETSSAELEALRGELSGAVARLFQSRCSFSSPGNGWASSLPRKI